MKKRIRILVLSIFFSFNVSCAMEKDEIPLLYLAYVGMVGVFFGAIIGKIVKNYCAIKELANKKEELTRQIKEEKEIQKFASEKEREITELHKACESNDIEKVASLLESKKFDINAQYKTNDGWYSQKDKTPLHVACESGNEDIVDLLLSQNDIDLTIQDLQGNTAFHIACSKENVYIVKNLFLCDKKFDINLKNKKEQTPLTLAYLNKSYDVFSFLLELEDIDPMETLCVACYYNDSVSFERLLKHKNIEFQDNRALYVACRMGYVEMVRTLLEYNKNDCMKVNELVKVDAEWYREKPSGWPYRCYNPLLITCWELITPRNILYKSERKTGFIREKFIEIIKLLLAHQFIDVSKKVGNSCQSNDETYESVIHLVVSDSELLQLLLAKDASFINVKCYQETPLEIAIKEGNIDSVRLLIKHGADIFTEDYRGYNALGLACESVAQDSNNASRIDIAKELLEAYNFSGKECMEKDIRCLSECLYLLISKKGTTHKDICNQLLLYGADPHYTIRKLWYEKTQKKCKFYPEKKKNFFSSPALKAAKYDVPILNIFLNKHPIAFTQRNHREHTILFRAFMFNQIQRLEEVQYFKDLDQQQKQKEIKSELCNLIYCVPSDIIKLDKYDFYEKKKENANNTIQRLYTFAATCNGYAKIDTQMLEAAYIHAKARSYLDADGNWQRGVWLAEREANGDHYVEVNETYNELTLHALIQHINPQTPEQKADKAIALKYKENPTQYYLSYKKKDIKDYFLSMA